MSEPLDLDAIEARAKAATPGPWTHEKNGGMVYAYEMRMRVFDIRGWGYLTGVGGLHMKEEAAIKVQEANGDFVVNAREDVPAMAREIRRLLEENAEHKERYERLWKQATEQATENERLREENARLAPFSTEYVAGLMAELSRYDEENRWIPVTERLPEHGVEVLVWWSRIDLIEIGHYNAKSRSFVTHGYYTQSVTHWRPLPKPPEVG